MPLICPCLFQGLRSLPVLFLHSLACQPSLCSAPLQPTRDAAGEAEGHTEEQQERQQQHGEPQAAENMRRYAKAAIGGLSTALPSPLCSLSSAAHCSVYWKWEGCSTAAEEDRCCGGGYGAGLVVPFQGPFCFRCTIGGAAEAVGGEAVEVQQGGVGGGPACSCTLPCPPVLLPPLPLACPLPCVQAGMAVKFEEA
ncbi:unnamed protein product [Closterium sp. NIES-64]|nr:unnamed protein product [Closterium sp. NIES-64]